MNPRDPYAEWKATHGYHEAEANKWKSNLERGQIVVATRDIELFEGSRNYVPEGTQGVVIGPDETWNVNVWEIRWTKKRYTLWCYYSPSRVELNADEAWEAFSGVEVVPLELWQKFYPAKADDTSTRKRDADQPSLFQEAD